MRALTWLFLSLLYVLTSGFIVGGQRSEDAFDAHNTVTISLAQELFVDLPNRITLRSLKPLVKITVNMTTYGLNTLNVGVRTFERPAASVSGGDGMLTYELKYYVPIELSPGSYFDVNITYFYCLSGTCDEMRELVSRSVQKSVRLVSHFVVILGETEKPVYRPGERVRFRFIALTSRDVVPSSEPLVWPEYRAVGGRWERKRLEVVGLAERRRRTKAAVFDVIEVKDPLDSVVEQWKNVSLSQALSLSHKLMGDATEGEWKIEGRVKEESEEIAFQVRHYVLPRFQAHVEMAKTIEPTDAEVKFSVCATYTNGPVMRGTYDAQVCVCERGIVERQETVKKLMPKNECTSNYGSVRRECKRFRGLLDHFACTEVRANITQLVQLQSPGWMDRLGVFVEVAEEDTGSAIVVSAMAEFRMWPEPKLELKMATTFRHGIPIDGQVVYRNTANGTEERLELTLREVTNPCGGWMMSHTDNPTRLKRILVVKGGEETVDFVLPPVTFTNPALVTVRQVGRREGTEEEQSAEMEGGYVGRWWLPRPRPRWDLEASQRLRLWDDSTGFAIAVSVLNESQVSCPGSVELQVQANKLLPTGTTLTLEFLSRGQLIARKVELVANYACVSNDDEFGHYVCVGEREIRCLKGWTGANCMTPVCEGDGCGVGGVCVAPGRCSCKSGWQGHACDICVPRKGCRNGVCVEGGDCVCKPGFTGYRCERATVSFEEGGEVEESVNGLRGGGGGEGGGGGVESDGGRSLGGGESETARRTVFKHKATLRLDGEFGPHFRAVAYVVSEGEMASDFVKIDGLQACASPVMADTTAGGGGLRFDKQVVVPGEKVNVSLRLMRRGDGGDEGETTCLLSMSDVATKNFDTSKTRRIDMEAFMRKLKDYHNIHEWHSVQSSKDAFTAVGISFSRVSMRSEFIVPTIICPLYMSGVWRLENTIRPTDYISSEAQSTSFPPRDIAESEQNPKASVREFFPEVWLFETAKLLNGSLNRTLTVPDSLTTWEANMVCLTAETGLWMPAKKSQLTVRMPFFVEFVPPVRARRGEVLHLPISVFVYPERRNTGSRPVGEVGSDSAEAEAEAEAEVEGEGESESGSGRTRESCYDVEVRVEVDPRDWRMVGASVLSTCICAGDLKETFHLPLRPLRMGDLNITAIATAQSVSGVCAGGDDVSNGRGKKTRRRRRMPEVVTVVDAVRRGIRVTAEGVEKRLTIGDIVCTSGGSSEGRQEMTVELEERRIVADSLRSYVAVSGNVVGRALDNLDALVQVPTGCGEQNLVKVAPSVYVLRHLLLLLRERGHNLTRVDKSHESELVRKTATYIVKGFENQLKYRHPDNGAFSTFGPHHGANGSTWLTAYVFEVFSEAEKLPIASIAQRVLDAHATLASAFDFLVGQQDASGDGCFTESGRAFLPWMQGSTEVANRLQLTAHVLAALNSASPALREAKGKQFTSAVRSALACVEATIERLPFTQWSTSLLAKVVYATKGFRDVADMSVVGAMIGELGRRSRTEWTLGGSWRWWPESVGERMTRSHSTQVLDLTTTAYALLALSPEHLSREDRLATMRWMSRQQNEKGGFYSTQDTVVALHALMQLADAFPAPSEPTFVVIEATPRSQLRVRTEVSEANRLVSQTFEIGAHNESDISSVRVHIKSSTAACVSVHFTAIYHVPEAQREEETFALEVSVDQGGSSATAACTEAHVTLCLRSMRPQTSGMLLMTLQLPTGWTAPPRELDRVSQNEALQRVELNAQRQEVSAYFNGFTGAEGDTERCVTMTLHQRTFVEGAEAGLVMARDYYNPMSRVQAPVQLDTCQLYWEPLSGGLVDVTPTPTTSIATTTTTTGAMENVATTAAPTTRGRTEESVCPKCADVSPSDWVEHLNKSLCFYNPHLYIFKPHNHSNGSTLAGVMYSFDFGRRLASWNTTVGVLGGCECPSTSDGIIGLSGPYIQAGALNVDLSGHEVVAFSEVVKAAPHFEKALRVKREDVEEMGRRPWCASHRAFLTLLRKLSSTHGYSSKYEL